MQKCPRPIQAHTATVTACALSDINQPPLLLGEEATVTSSLLCSSWVEPTVLTLRTLSSSLTTDSPTLTPSWPQVQCRLMVLQAQEVPAPQHQHPGVV